MFQYTHIKHCESVFTRSVLEDLIAFLSCCWQSAENEWTQMSFHSVLHNHEQQGEVFSLLPLHIFHSLSFLQEDQFLGLEVQDLSLTTSLNIKISSFSPLHLFETISSPHIQNLCQNSTFQIHHMTHSHTHILPHNVYGHLFI